jgi:hypothetical protein
VGVSPAPGYQKHPAFKGFAEIGFSEGFLTNGGNQSSVFAWEDISPSGKVIANQLDVAYGQMENYAIVVEYQAGKGKVAIVDGNSLDLIPVKNHFLPEIKGQKNGKMHTGNIKWNTRFGLRERVRKFMLNLAEYLGSDQHFQPDMEAAKALKEKLLAEKEKRANIVELPKEKGWLFKLDPKNVGESEKWFVKDLDTKDWKPIKVALSWEAQGYDYNGNAWYRLKFKAANRKGKKAYLYFGAVDEKATVYLNGKKLGESHGEWNKPFEFEITSLLSDKEQEYTLSVKVYDLMAAGGIWKPVSIIYKKDK